MEIFMRNIFLAFIATLTLNLTTAHAADFQKGLTAYKAGDYATALKEWKPKAEQDDARAQSNLAVLYLNGQGVPQDYVRTLVWFNIAAANGHGKAGKQRDKLDFSRHRESAVYGA
jgi:TPR repeat protein